MNRRRLFKFELEHNEVVGLDIGNSAVKLIQMRKDNSGYTVTTASIVKIAPTEGDEYQREMNTIEAIRECVKSSRIKTRLAVCGVSGPEVAVRNFSFPSLSGQEVGGAVMLEAAQVCPFNTEDGTIDYQLIPESEDIASGVLVAATNSVINSKAELAEGASLDCVLMDVDGLALLNCFSEYEKPEDGQGLTADGEEQAEEPLQQDSGHSGVRQTTAILNVGSSFTNLAIIGDNGLPFIRDIAYAGNDIVLQLARANDMSPEAVTNLLFSCENSPELSVALGDSLGKACEKLIVDVTETLRYYAAQEKSSVVEKIYVCGGFSLFKEFVELLDRHLPGSVVLWNPFDKIGCAKSRSYKSTLERRGPALAVAAGLAMRSI